MRELKMLLISLFSYHDLTAHLADHSINVTTIRLYCFVFNAQIATNNTIQVVANKRNNIIIFILIACNQHFRISVQFSRQNLHYL